MKFQYNNLEATQILKKFPKCLPCFCFADETKEYEFPRYNVSVGYCPVLYFEDGKEYRYIKYVTVDCDCCGEYQSFDVEHLGIRSDELENDW